MSLLDTLDQTDLQRRIGDVCVSLRSDLKAVLDDFVRIYPPSGADGATTGRAIRIEVRRSGRTRTGRRLYRVYADGAEIGGSRPANGVFPLVEWGINLRMIETRGEFLQLHAASMAHRGAGFIFAAESGSGKSTLAALLLARGWRYLCDEFALVDIDKMCLHPFPKALCIKAGSYPLVRRLGLRFARRRDYIKQSKGRVGYINPCDVGPNAVGGVTPVRFIILPQYSGRSEARLRSISRARAVLELSRCCFTRPGSTPAAVPALVKIVRAAECFRLEVGSPDATARLLEAMLDSYASAAEVQTPAPTPVPEVQGARPRVAPLRSRREVLRFGAKLAYVTPAVFTLTASQAFADGSNPSGACSTGLAAGSLCETDADCCSTDCDFGVCQ